MGPLAGAERGSVSMGVPAELTADIRGTITENLTSLSPKQRIVAELLFEDPYLVAYTPASEVAAHLGFDTATVVRATQSLGFEGWRDLQRLVRESIQGGSLFADRVKSRGASGPGELFTSMRDQMLETIGAAFGPAQLYAMGTAVDLLLGSDRTFVVGGGTSTGPAHFAASSLNIIGHHAHPVLDAESASVVISTVTPGSTVIVFALRRYLKWMVEFAAFAASQGAALVAVVDSHSSPIALVSRATVCIPAKRLGTRLDTLGLQAVAHAIPSSLAAHMARGSGGPSKATGASDRFTHAAAMIHHHPGREDREDG